MKTKNACLASLWRQEFDALRSLGAKYVVLQHTLSDGHMFFDGTCAAGMCDDAAVTADQRDVIRLSLSLILQEAERAGIDVWVGLRYRKSWEQNGWSELIRNDPARFVRENIAVADAITTALGDQAQLIAGWYIPMEVDNRKPAVDSKAVLTNLSKTLKKPVIISAFFRANKKNLAEADFLTMLRGSVAGSGLRAVLFQDGVGVRGLTASSLTDAELQDIRKRYQNVAAAVGDSGSKTTMWPILEVFKCEKCTVPGSAARLRKQKDAAANYENRTIFEFSHLVSPVTATACRRPEISKLYSDLAALPNVRLCSTARCPE